MPPEKQLFPESKDPANPLAQLAASQRLYEERVADIGQQIEEEYQTGKTSDAAANARLRTRLEGKRDGLVTAAYNARELRDRDIRTQLGSDLFGMDEVRAARIAKKRNEKQREKYPLFADSGFLEETSADEVKRAADQHRERFAECCRRLQAQGDAFREQVRTLVSREEFDALERRRAVLPDGPEYHAGFWRERSEEIQKIFLKPRPAPVTNEESTSVGTGP